MKNYSPEVHNLRIQIRLDKKGRPEHLNDHLTPYARQSALKTGQALDRWPIVLFDNILAARLAGMTYPESESTAENIAKKEILAYRQFGHDDVTVIFGIRGLGVPLGGKTHTAPDTSPTIVAHALDSINALAELNPAAARFENDPRQQKLYRALELIQAEIGAEVPSRFCMCAPFTAAAGLLEAEKLLRSTRKQPEKVHELLRFVTDLLLPIIDKFAEIDNIIFHLADPVASGSLISPKQYQEFCQPYTRELVDRIHQHHKPVTLHICGDTSKLLEMIADTGIDCFSIDQKVDLALAKAKIGDRVTLLGNVDPVQVLLQGTPASIDEAVKACFAKAYDSPKGFIIGPGCDIPYATPTANIEAFMAAARKYAEWPLDPARFADS